MGYNMADLQGEKAERMAAALEAIALNGAGAVVSDQNWKAAQNLVRAGLGAKAYPVGTQFQVHKESSLAATLGTHTGISAVTVDEETFLAAEGIVGSGVHEFTFDGGAWIYDGSPVRLADFGLSVTGTAAEGDEIIVTEAFDTILFDVVDHRQITDPVTGESKPGMVLFMHHCIYGRQVDQSEAMYYAEEALPAGNYCFTVKNQTWYTADNDKTYYFTLTQDVPAGGQICLSMTNNATLEGKSAKTYASPTSTEVIETATLSATALTGAVNLGNTDGTALNHMHRIIMGSNNYKESAIRQWINSKAAANAWWKKTNNFDRPADYANVAGLLHGMDADFLAVVGPVIVPCKTNNTYELPGWTLNSAYTVTDKFFLASRNEMGWGTENVAEGSVFALYNGATNADKIKRDQSAQSAARYWWLRSPYPGYAYNVRNVYLDGSLSGNLAYNGIGAAAACVIY